MFITKFTWCNDLKYYKIRFESRENKPIKPFKFQFTCVQPVFLLVISFKNKLWLLKLYLLKGAKSLSEETGTVFTTLLLFGEMKHEEIRRLTSALIEKNPKVAVSAATLLFEFCDDHVKKSKIAGTWADAVYILCIAAYLSDRFALSRRHRKSGFLLNRL